MSVTGHSYNPIPKPEIQAPLGPPSALSFTGGMTEEEYQTSISNLGLGEGEQVKLQIVCFRREMTPSVWSAGHTIRQNKGLLVLTNDSMIFVQQEGAWHSNYSQALKIPLEQVVGLTAVGTVVQHLRFAVGATGSETHEFVGFGKWGNPSAHEVRGDIERLMREAREEKKRNAQIALAIGSPPQMIFCRFCGARNRNDQMKCGNCAALLKKS